MSVGATEYEIAVGNAGDGTELTASFDWPASETELVVQALNSGTGEVADVTTFDLDLVGGTYTVTADNPWPTESARLIVTRRKLQTQEVNLQEAVALDPAGIDAQLDAMVRFDQENRADIDRRCGVVNPADVFNFPPAAVRASHLVGFDVDGAPTLISMADPAHQLGDMTKSVYDADDDGIVNQAEAIVGQGALATKSTVNNGEWSGTDLSVLTGGTGASTAAAARTNLAAAAAADLSAHTARSDNPHAVTKSQVGLGNVVNALQLQAANDLSDLANAGTARNNLGLGNAATKDTGTGSGNVATGNHNHAGVYATADHEHTSLSGDLEFSSTKGVVLTDRATGTKYRAYFTGGRLRWEVVA